MKSKREDLFLYGLLILFLISLFHRLDFLHLKFEEPRRALVSWEMIQSGNWLQPSIYTLPYYNKPPVYNWVLAVFMKLFGNADWVIRMPTVVSFLTIGVTNFFFWKSKIGRQGALWSSICFVTSVNIYFYFSFQGEIDMFYSMLVFLQVIGIVHYFEKGQFWQLFLISYLLTAVGFLTKGIPSIGFQGLTLIGIMLYSRRYRWFFSLQHLLSGCLSVLLIASFFYFYYVNGGHTDLYLSKIFFEGARRTVNHQQTFSFLRNFLSFIPLFLYLLSPWAIISLFGLNKAILKKQLNNPWLVYTLVFLVCNLPLYWLSAGTRDRYLYMFLPFCMVWLVPWLLNSVDKKSFRTASALTTLLLALSIFILVFMPLLDMTLSANVIAIAAGIVLLVSGWLIFKEKLNPLHGWFVLLVVFRITFNWVVLDERKKNEKSADYPELIQTILLITDHQPVYYRAPLVQEEVPLPLIDRMVTFQKVERLDYTFTYYLNRATGQTVKHISNYPEEGYVIEETGSSSLHKTNEVMLVFLLGKKQYQLVKI